MKNNRMALAKTYLTFDQHDTLVADAKAAGDSVSDVLRNCWLKCRNGIPASRPPARPNLAPFRAKFAPSRNMRPAVHMRS